MSHDARPDARPNGLPDARRDARSDARSDGLLGARRGGQPDGRPDARLDPRLDARPDAWSVAPEPFDSPDAVALWRECYRHMSDSWYLLKENRRTDPDELEREIAADPGTELAPPRGALVVARRDGAAAGMAGVRLLDDERAELKRVFLRPEFRGSGGAELVVRAAEDEARRLGAHRMVLEARSDFVAARALYRRLGYEDIEPYTFERYAEHWYGKAL